MKAALPLAAILLVVVAACDKPKPRRLPASAAATAPTQAPVLTPAASTGLAKRPGMAVFSLDLINEAADPLNTRARIKAGAPTTFSGFGFDPVAKAAGKAIDIVIDGAAYGTTCCHDRPDVSAYYKSDAILPSGFRVTLPAGTIKRGPHTVIVRVVSADGAAFNDSATLSFDAQ